MAVIVKAAAPTSLAGRERDCRAWGGFRCPRRGPSAPPDDAV